MERGPEAARARRRAGQAGSSLVEVLVAVVLAGVTVLAIAAGLLTITVAGAGAESRQDLQSALAGYTESLKILPFDECADGGAAPGDYQAAEAADPAAFEPPDRVALQVTRVEHWDPETASFVDHCPSADSSAQRLSVRADLDERTSTAQVVVRRP